MGSNSHTFYKAVMDKLRVTFMFLVVFCLLSNGVTAGKTKYPVQAGRRCTRACYRNSFLDHAICDTNGKIWKHNDSPSFECMKCKKGIKASHELVPNDAKSKCVNRN